MLKNADQLAYGVMQYESEWWYNNFAVDYLARTTILFSQWLAVVFWVFPTQIDSFQNGKKLSLISTIWLNSETLRIFVTNDALFLEANVSRSDFSKKKRQNRLNNVVLKSSHVAVTSIWLSVLQLFFGCVSLELFQDVVTHTELIPLSVTDGTI